MPRIKSKTGEKLTDAEITEIVVEGMRERRGIRPGTPAAETLRLERRETVQLRQTPEIKVQFSAGRYVYSKPLVNMSP